MYDLRRKRSKNLWPRGRIRPRFAICQPRGAPSRHLVRAMLVFIVHVGCRSTRCVTSSTDQIVKILARITLSVEFIRTCIFIFLFYVWIQWRVWSILTIVSMWLIFRYEQCLSLYKCATPSDEVVGGGGEGAPKKMDPQTVMNMIQKHMNSMDYLSAEPDGPLVSTLLPHCYHTTTALLPNYSTTALLLRAPHTQVYQQGRAPVELL